MINDAIKSFIDQLGYRLKRKAVGDDYLQELVWQLRDVSRPILFDVGAHRGETAINFSHLFPGSQLYCFEPFPESFDLLTLGSKAYPEALLFNMGLAESTGTKELNVNVGSPTNSLLELDSRASQTWNHENLKPLGKLECQFTSLDDFVEQYQIDKIDLLKLDVQGAELRVLEGASQTMLSGRIRAIYLEIIVGPTYVGQWGLGQYLSYLEGKGFHVAGLYNFAYGVKRNIIQLDALCLRIA
jgi:FkbM family methyltransferase